MEIIYRLLIFAIHKSIFIVSFVIERTLILYWYLKQIQLSGFSFLPEDILKRTKYRIAHFDKLPSHIGIVINEDVISFQHIANIIVWCLTLGVPHLSIYDSNGLVKSRGLNLYKHTVRCKDKYLSKNSEFFKVAFHNTQNNEFQNGVTNGHTYEKELQVYLLSCEDGKLDIINAAQTVCREIIAKNLDPIGITKTKFSKYLRALHNNPDPELVLCFGRGSSLIGYLPWHVNLSEILFQTSHKSFQLSQLIDALEKYNTCQQRFGK